MVSGTASNRIAAPTKPASENQAGGVLPNQLGRPKDSCNRVLQHFFCESVGRQAFQLRSADTLVSRE
jgi:hypothetical protein